jgi:hypothetical protein
MQSAGLLEQVHTMLTHQHRRVANMYRREWAHETVATGNLKATVGGILGECQVRD